MKRTIGLIDFTSAASQTKASVIFQRSTSTCYDLVLVQRNIVFHIFRIFGEHLSDGREKSWTAPMCHCSTRDYLLFEHSFERRFRASFQIGLLSEAPLFSRANGGAAHYISSSQLFCTFTELAGRRSGTATTCATLSAGQRFPQSPVGEI